MDHLTFTRSVTFGRRSLSELDLQAGRRWWGLPQADQRAGSSGRLLVIHSWSSFHD